MDKRQKTLRYALEVMQKLSRDLDDSTNKVLQDYEKKLKRKEKIKNIFYFWRWFK